MHGNYKTSAFVFPGPKRTGGEKEQTSSRPLRAPGSLSFITGFPRSLGLLGRYEDALILLCTDVSARRGIRRGGPSFSQ